MPPSYIRVRAVVWAYGRGQTDTQTSVTTIHFASSTTHATCNNLETRTEPALTLTAAFTNVINMWVWETVEFNCFWSFVNFTKQWCISRVEWRVKWVQCCWWDCVNPADLDVGLMDVTRSDTVDWVFGWFARRPQWLAFIVVIAARPRHLLLAIFARLPRPHCVLAGTSSMLNIQYSCYFRSSLLRPFCAVIDWFSNFMV